jgi:hypothetical protein
MKKKEPLTLEQLKNEITNNIYPALTTMKCNIYCLESIKTMYMEFFKTNNQLNLGCSTCVKQYLNEIIKYYQKNIEPQLTPVEETPATTTTDSQTPVEELDLNKKKKGCCKQSKPRKKKE